MANKAAGARMFTCVCTGTCALNKLMSQVWLLLGSETELKRKKKTKNAMILLFKSLKDH